MQSRNNGGGLMANVQNGDPRDIGEVIGVFHTFL